MVDVWGLLVRLITMGRVSIYVPGMLRRALARGVYCSMIRCATCEVIVGDAFPFSDLNQFRRGVAASGIRMSDVCGYEEADEVGFMSGGY
jgi:hypothetical protein